MQNATLDDNIYFLLLLGMVAVGAHAYNLFNQPVDRPSASSRWRFLSTIPIQLSTTQSRFRLGLVLYVMVFELFYLVLASSSSLLLMTYQVSGRQDLTGALSDTVSPNGTVPILASTAIILLTQIRPLSRMELVVRQVAHRIARVPDGLKLVKQRASGYLRRAELSSDVIEKEMERIEPSVDPHIFRRLKESQIVTAWLFEHTLGPTGSLSWDEDGSEELLRLFHSNKLEVMQLRSEILDLSRQVNDKDKDKDKDKDESESESEGEGEGEDGSGLEDPELEPQARWQELLDKSLHLEENLTVLLCLLIINQPEVDTRDEKELKVLIESTHQREQSEVSDIAIKSCILGAIASLFVMFLYERIDTSLRADLRQSPYSSKAPYGSYIESRLHENDSSAVLYRLGGLSGSEQQGWVIDGSFRSDMRSAIEEAFWNAIAFFVTVSVVLSMNSRNVRLWRNEEARSNSEVTPAAQYAIITASAALTVASVLFVYVFLTKALIPALHNNVDVLSLQIMTEFSIYLPSILRTSLAVMVCAIFIVWVDGLFAQIACNRKGSKDKGRSPWAHKPLPLQFRAVMTGFLISISIALLVLVTKLAMENSVEYLEAIDIFITTLGVFTTFLVVLMIMMRLHPQRYLKPVDIPDRGKPMTSEPDAGKTARNSTVSPKRTAKA